MLEEIRIVGLGVIAEATLDLGVGLTVITGETGAGKTMLLQGLGLLLGGRADSGVVRSGSDRAIVEGRLRLPKDSAVRAVVDELGGLLDDDVVIVSRSVSSDGRSRATIGGRSAPVGALGEIAESMVAVHGQSDQQRLLRPGHQRVLLDRFGVDPDLGAKHREAHRAWTELREHLQRIEQEAGVRVARAEQLREDLARIEAVSPLPGELDSLEGDLSRLVNAESLHDMARRAHAELAGDPDAAGEGPDAIVLVAGAAKALRHEVATDPTLQPLADDLDKATEIITDVAAELSRYLDGLDADPQRVESLQSRKAALTTLVRRYARSLDEVIAYAQSAAAELAEFDDDTLVPRLRAELAAAESACAESARVLHAARCAAAERLEAAAGTELVGLAMPHATLRVAVNYRPSADGIPVDGEMVAVGADGADEVEILLAAHGGANPRPLHKGASGGELSRVMLALEVALAGTDPVPTMVFDEVDAGVGGKAAIEVGARLARLGLQHQVLCVTHLPQVAAFADHHLVVRKTDDGAVTASGVSRIEGDDRLEELSRMLAGMDESEHARAHAQELLDLSAHHRATWKSR